MDLLNDVTIYSVVTQGRHRDDNQWVTSFTMSYKPHNSNHFRSIVDDDGEAKVSFKRISIYSLNELI